MRQVGYLQELNRDARPTKHKIRNFIAPKQRRGFTERFKKIG